jgi:preprotein translocase subunit SecG
MLLGLLLVIQILISVLLVVVILLQSSKGGGLAGIAGGLTSSTVFGGRSAANFLTKATTILTTLFFINCLGMAILTAHADSASSVTQQAVRTEGTSDSPVPAIPGGQTINTQPTTTQSAPMATPVQVNTQPATGTTEQKPAEGK